MNQIFFCQMFDFSCNGMIRIFFPVNFYATHPNRTKELHKQWSGLLRNPKPENCVPKQSFDLFLLLAGMKTLLLFGVGFTVFELQSEEKMIIFYLHWE